MCSFSFTFKKSEAIILLKGVGGGLSFTFCTSTIYVIRRFSSYTGGGRPKVRLCTLFKGQSGTRVEPPTFRKLAGELSHKKNPTTPVRLKPAAARQFHERKNKNTIIIIQLYLI
jgi:hypothetical protein